MMSVQDRTAMPFTRTATSSRIRLCLTLDAELAFSACMYRDLVLYNGTILMVDV